MKQAQTIHQAKESLGFQRKGMFLTIMEMKNGMRARDPVRREQEEEDGVKRWKKKAD